MAFFRERNNPLRLLGKRLFIALLATLVISAAWGVWDIYRKNRESARLRAEAEGRLAELEVQQSKLELDLAELQTQRGMEAALRQQYAVAGRGEGLIVIVEPDKPKLQTASSSPWEWIAKMFRW